MGEVKTKLTIVDNASAKMNKINQSLQRMATQFRTLSTTGNKFGNNLNTVGKKATLATNKVNRFKQAVQSANGTMARNTSVLGSFSSSAKKASTSTSGLVRSLRRLAAAYLGVMTTRTALSTADSITGSNNKFVTLGTMEYGMDKDTAQAFSDETMQKIFNSAQSAATGYTDMMANVSKSVTLAGKSFGKTQQQQIDNAIVFQEVMAKSYALAGASAAEQASSMYQLVQALGSGILQGDELRSVREGAPLAYQAIEKFAQGVYDTDSSLKDLASDGMITSDIVVAAILDMEGKTNKAFENIDLTWAMIWTRFKNEVTMAFKPFFEKLREIANSPEFQFLVDKAIIGINWIAEKLTWLLGVIQNVMTWISNHWVAFQSIMAAGIFVLGSMLIIHIVNSISAFLTFLKTLEMAQIKMIALIAIMALIIMSVGFLTDATGSLATALGIVAIMLGIILIIWSLITAGATLTITLVIGLILVLLGVIMAFTEQVVGAVFWLAALIANIVIGLINALIQFVWSNFAEPFLGIIEWILNACNGGFNSFGGAVANLIGQIISWFLSLGKVVTKIIDAIFGTDWTTGLSNLQGEVISWGKTEEAITIDRTAPQIDRINMGNAYDTGASIGAGWHDSIENMLNGIGNKVKGATSLDTGNLANATNGGIAVADPSGLLDNIGKGIGKDAKDTAKNTGKMAKSMDLTAEDLKYLRQIAEMEAINKFTTAEIKVDMTNNNTVNNTNDLDGLVTLLSGKLREELSVMAEGVHL